MSQIWKETIVDCPIHGRRIKKIPIYQQKSSFNAKHYLYKKASLAFAKLANRGITYAVVTSVEFTTNFASCFGLTVKPP